MSQRHTPGWEKMEAAADAILEELLADPGATEPGFERGLLCAFAFAMGVVEKDPYRSPEFTRGLFSTLVVQLGRRAEH